MAKSACLKTCFYFFFVYNGTYNTLKKCAKLGSVWSTVVLQNFYGANKLQKHTATSKNSVNKTLQVLVYESCKIE